MPPTTRYPAEWGVEFGKPPPGEILAKVPWGSSTVPEQN